MRLLVIMFLDTTLARREHHDLSSSRYIRMQYTRAPRVYDPLNLRMFGVGRRKITCIVSVDISGSLS